MTTTETVLTNENHKPKKKGKSKMTQEATPTSGTAPVGTPAPESSKVAGPRLADHQPAYTITREVDGVKRSLTLYKDTMTRGLGSGTVIAVADVTPENVAQVSEWLGKETLAEILFDAIRKFSIEAKGEHTDDKTEVFDSAGYIAEMAEFSFETATMEDLKSEKDKLVNLMIALPDTDTEENKATARLYKSKIVKLLGKIDKRSKKKNKGQEDSAPAKAA